MYFIEEYHGCTQMQEGFSIMRLPTRNYHL